MSDTFFVSIIVAIVVFHFLAAVGFLLWKIFSATKNESTRNKIDEEKNEMD